MKSFASLTCTILVLLLLVIVEDINAAAVGKGAVGAGGRSVKGARQKTGGRKSGQASKISRSGTSNLVVPDSPSAPAGSSGFPMGRQTEESEAYYNNPNGSRILDASHFESEYILGRKLAFYCKAQGIPRPQITWLKDGIELYAHPFFHVHEYKVGKDQIKSKMEIDPAVQKDSGYYECQADNQYAIDKRGFRTDYTLDVY